MRENITACEVEKPPENRRKLFKKDLNVINNTLNQNNNNYITEITKEFNQKDNKSNYIHKDNFRTQFFRKQWFPNVTNREWNDWRWQLKNRLCSFDEINKIFQLSEEESYAFFKHKDKLPVAITPYYASLLDAADSSHSLRKAVLPVIREVITSPGESADPLGETEQSPVPCIVHRYPDRVLFLVTNMCACYCRYCTRSRIMVHNNGDNKHLFNKKTWENGIDYIESHPEVRDVLLSGGDPLLLPDLSLQWLLQRLRKIKHVKILRIGTKVPVVLPQRITPFLVDILKQYHPLLLSIHFTHPDELTQEVRQACNALADAGIPLGSQTVLLSGINDEINILRRMFQELLTMRVRPYYLYQCDPIIGSAHFRTPISKGIEIIKALRGFISGYAIPQFVIDAPGGGGKIPLSPDYVVGYEDDTLILKNYRGKEYRYYDIKQSLC